MTHLSKSFHCYALCIRGHGYSTYNTPVEEFEEVAEDVLEWMGVVGVEDFLVGGASLGNGVAMMVGLAGGDRCKGLIVLGGMNPRGVDFTGMTEDHNSVEDLKSIPGKKYLQKLILA